MPDITNGTLNNFYNTSRDQYIIPPYQRTITWPSDQWKALFNDIVGLLDDPSKKHLIQMFQLQSDETGSKFIVGDGQQRLVHTSLILLALAHSLKEISKMKEIVGSRLELEIAATYGRILPDNSSTLGAMLSFYADGERKPKVVVAPGNQKAYEALVFWEYDSLPKENSKKCIVQHAFEFYKRELTYFLLVENTIYHNMEGGQHSIYDYSVELIGNLEDINNKANNFMNAMEYRLVFASAHFKSREEMQASYENTNSRSVALTESELIKNNIFKNFDPLTKQETLVSKYWQFFDNDYWINKDAGDKNLYDKNSPKRPSDDRLDDLFYYHLTAAMKKYGSFPKKEHHATFKAFKNFYENESQLALNKKRKSLTPEERENFDGKAFLSNYYENILKTVKRQGELYYKLDTRDTTKGDKFEERSKDFYYRVIDACNMPAAYALLFALMEKGVSYERFDAILGIYESYMIRKSLSPNPNSVSLYNLIFKYIEDNTSIEDIKSNLAKDTTKTGSWEGDSDIIRYQKKKLWKGPGDNKLAVLLITDYENSGNHIVNGLNDRLPYKRDKSSIEHFMPQNPKRGDWDIKSNEHGARERLTYSFGNLFIIPGAINGKLRNDSFQDKKNTLSEHLNPNGSLGFSSLDFAYNATKWDEPEIEKHLEEKLTKILKKYEGPSRTINKHEGSALLVDGIVEPNQKIYHLSKKLVESIAVIQEDGAILFNDSLYTNFKELNKVVEPLEKGKDHLARWAREINGTTQLLPLNVKPPSYGKIK